MTCCFIMPIYIPKKSTFSPPSNFEIEPENDNDYLLDPDQLWDCLPQPYRMINKIINQVLDSVWEIVKQKEKDAIEAASHVQPPSFESHNIVEGFEMTTSMTFIAVEDCLLIGLPDGLSVIDAQNFETVTEWDDPHAEIVSVQSLHIGKEMHLIVTIDSLGICRLFLFALGNLFCIKAINENAPQAEVKTLCQKCFLSQGGEYIGVVLENSSTHEVYVELYKSPIETWITELESKALLIQDKETDKEAESISFDKFKSQLNILEYEESIHTPETSLPKKSIRISLDKLSSAAIIWAPPELIAKLKPAAPLNAAISSLPPVITSAKGGDSSDVLGMGHNHILNATHLSRREMMFKHRNEHLIKYLPEEKQELSSSPNIHFLPISRLLPNDLDTATSAKAPVSLAVWWTGHPIVAHYSLSKTSKDLEWKPDLVWPYSSNITCSAVSGCGTHLALGLEDGSTVIWDWKLGLCKSVLKGPEKNSVKSLRFLEPSLYPIDQPKFPPYNTISATYVLAEYSKGSQLLFDTLHSSHQIPQSLATEPEDDDKLPTVIQIIPHAPQLMFLVEKGGKMFVKDITTGSLVCQIQLPSPYTLQSPWEPIFAFTDKNHSLFVKGEGLLETAEGSTERSTCLFHVQLETFPALASYFNVSSTEDVPLTVFNTLDQRIASLQFYRDQQMADRKARWATIWADLPSQLTSVQQGLVSRCNSQLMCSPKLNASTEPHFGRR
ncbi:WD repeat-containing protein 93-like isoform X1 [Biomphalaria glabrata]|uniref:WD repeat-containing protein 93-like isoform X1 n=2 Tax=Biomphalaria glabrata TaxID=6526 RepID=A0A9W3BNZ4_BIOGL|nr:WD repeat-containing protein 93-like isoform X1 [Biomphalaria glabrata]